MSAFVRSKPHVNIGTIGHVDHGKVRSHRARSECFCAHWPPTRAPLQSTTPTTRVPHAHTLWSSGAHPPLVHHSSPSHPPLVYHTHTLFGRRVRTHHSCTTRTHSLVVGCAPTTRVSHMITPWHTHHSCASHEHSLVLSVTHQMMNFVSCFIYFCFHCVPCGCSCSHGKAPYSLPVPCMAHAHTT
jgi:hypothetical protein